MRAKNDQGAGAWSDSASGRSANVAPVFPAGPLTRSVAENTAAGQNVGSPVTAADTNADALTYTLEGTDAASFDIVASSGQIQTKAALNFEAKSSYRVTVKASDSRGGSATVDVTITVTDVDEPPGKPAAPTFGTKTASSLVVNWTAPANAGPPITDYDVQYREGDSGSFTDANVTGTGTTTTLSSLKADTAYQVQVRAKNAEGTGVWSDSGSASTGKRASTKVELSLDPSAVAEDASATTVTVTAGLDGGSRGEATRVTVKVGTGGTATSGTDYGAVSDFSITIAANTVEKTGTFTFTPTDDDVDEGDETVSVTGATTVQGLTVAGAELDDRRGRRARRERLDVEPDRGRGLERHL